MEGRGQKREEPTVQEKPEAGVSPEAKRSKVDSGYAPVVGGRDEADGLCVSVIRCLAPAMVSKAKSGHPGAPMGCAVMAHALFGHAMEYYPGKNPRAFWGRDRFVLSNGHASALQYVMHYLSGIGSMTMDDLKSFRQWDSITPGHPENIITPGVEVTTGPLGQGIAQAVGLAVAATQLRATYGPELFNNYVYTILGDGCMQEGVAIEACSLAGHWGLNNLIALYDDNKITIDGLTDLSFTENVEARFRASNWNVLRVANGDTDLGGVLAAIETAKKSTAQPTLIIVSTTIGYGSKKQGTSGVHGAPLAADDLAQLREAAGIKEATVKEGVKEGEASTDFLEMPEAVTAFYERKMAANKASYEGWMERREAFAKEHPAEYAELMRRFEGEGAAEFDQKVGEAVLTALASAQADAPRSVSQKILKVIAPLLPELIGGSADLKESNKTAVVEELGGGFHAQTNPKGRYLFFGIREHAMAAICNGLVAYGGFRAFNATFMNFYTYAWGAVRLSALSQLPVLMIATHDSIELGEDGPTHQPIETMALFRATPNFHCYRPADTKEAIGAYLQWLDSSSSTSTTTSKTPVCLALARGKTPEIDGTDHAKVAQGAYIITDFQHASGAAQAAEAAEADKENIQPGAEIQATPAPSTEKDRLIFAASGSELQLAVAAAELARAQGWNARVVSIVSWDRFREQSAEYQESVLPEHVCGEKVRRVLIEPYSSYGIGDHFDAAYSTTLDTFGHSAPAKVIYEKTGFTAQQIFQKAIAQQSTKTKN